MNAPRSRPISSPPKTSHPSSRVRRAASRSSHLSLVAALALVACEPSSNPADAGPPRDAASRVDARPPEDAGPLPDPRPAPRPLTRWVDPFVGTGGYGYTDIGSTFPGPQRPFGMARPGPDTGNARGEAAGFTHCSGYHADDTHVRAFSLWRLHGIGINDGGGAALMPAPDLGPLRTTQAGWLAAMRPGTEAASPGRYEVSLEPPLEGSGGVAVEITATERVGLYRFTWDAEATEPTVLFPLAHAHPGVEVREAGITVLADAREVEGSALLVGGYSDRFGGVRVFFVARADRPFARSGTFQPGAIAEGIAGASGAGAGAFVTFDPTAGRVATVAFALSFVDAAHARASLDAEAADLDLDRARDDAERAWEDRLSVVEVDARDERDFRRFYTALYHTLLMPSLATEHDGSYRGLDGATHVADGFTYHTDFSLWDTYRTLHPWLAVTAPDVARDLVRSLMAMAEDSGTYPRWPLGTGETGGMLGEPAALVIADAWARGVRDFDAAHALDLFDATAFADPPAGGGRGGMEAYLRLGYVPIESGGASAARTQEFAWADAALGVLARAVGRADEAATFEARGRSWRNTFDPAQGFVAGRFEDGRFAPIGDVFVWNDVYAEGNAWQYLWLAPQDLDGLADALGGRDMALARLREFFESSARERLTSAPPRWYWHGNEPDLHAPFLFALWGAPDESARWAAWARERHYGDGPTGLPGNDDGGTLSAWYLFASIGLYPVAGSDLYAIASPSLNRAVIHRADGDLVIEAPAAAPGVVVPEGVALDGAPLTDRGRITHGALTGAHTLRFDLAPSP